MNKIKIIFLMLIIALTAIQIQSHARLADDSDVPPRGINMKDSPCGENQRGKNPKILTAGTKIKIRWIETVDHTGTYWIEFSKANDKDWMRLKTVADDQNNPATLPHSYEATITVPNMNCDSCTIRLVQEMIDGHADAPTYYYSCGDIKIVNGKC